MIEISWATSLSSGSWYKNLQENLRKKHKILKKERFITKSTIDMYFGLSFCSWPGWPGVQSQVKSNQWLKKWYSIPPCLTLSIIKYVSRVTSSEVRRTRHAGHCWRSKDKLISDVLLWTPTYGRAKAGRPARTYIQQLCEDTGCNPEDLPEAMNDREKWRERVRDVRVGGMTWWWSSSRVKWSNPGK